MVPAQGLAADTGFFLSTQSLLLPPSETSEQIQQTGKRGWAGSLCQVYTSTGADSQKAVGVAAHLTLLLSGELCCLPMRDLTYLMDRDQVMGW